MIQISQNEAKYLRSRGRAKDVHMSSITSKSRGKRYYLTEDYKSLQLLEQYRKRIITYTYPPQPEDKKSKRRP